MSLLGSVGKLVGIGGAGADKSAPIQLVFKTAAGGAGGLLSGLASALPSPPSLSLGVDELLKGSTAIRTFTSYSFTRSLLSPAAPFRFTAPGVDAKTRQQIRSGDTVQLQARGPDGEAVAVATGFIDETDTHVSPGQVEYVLTGRDTLGQLVDNAVVDKQNRVIQTKNVTLEQIAQLLIANTRIPQSIETQQIDGGTLLFQTNPGETKMNTLQRFLEFANCLVWTLPNGQMVIGKPDTLQSSSGILACGTTGSPLPSLPSVGGLTPQSANVLDARVRRDCNTAIRQIVVQLQNLNNVDAGAYTIQNQDQDMKKVSGSGVGRSVYEVFSYGEGAQLVNFLKFVGNFSGAPDKLGAALAQRVLARENVKVLDVELTVQGHFNTQGDLYDVDQIYEVHIPDDDVSEKMYVYSVNHEMTIDHGMITKLRLCKAGGTLVAGTFQMPVLTIPLPKLPKL